MHATDVLDTCLPELCQTMHASRYVAVKAAVSSALAERCVSVTGLGRGVGNSILEKYNIKRMDRLIGNPRLLGEAALVYGEMTNWLVSPSTRPHILVDWSPVSVDGRFHVLRASVPAEGRALTLYEEVHERTHLGSRRVQIAFLNSLAELLPSQCRPIVVTDAGFKNPWFRAVEALGWDWVGRIRGTVQISRPNESLWIRCTSVGRLLETGRPTYLGNFLVARSNPIECSVYGLRKPPKGRRRKTPYGNISYSKPSKTASAREREPWLIATSLPGGAKETKAVLAAYRKRMSIEENFRDTKSEYYGFGLERARSRSTERYSVLLLVNALAVFVAWLFGKAARSEGIDRGYQANTIRSRAVLSCVFLGLRVISRGDIQMTTTKLRQLRAIFRGPELAVAA